MSSKITALIADTSPSADDLVVTVDAPGGTPANKKVTLGNIDTLFAGTTKTLTNKTIDLTDNTLSGTLAEFNTALSDGSFASLAGAETLTNKTIDGSANTISNINLASQVTGSLPATSVSITDSGGYFSGSTAEAALQELGADVAALDAAVTLQGTWDASSGSFPGGGSAQAGYSYIVSVGGTVDGEVFTANDRIVAITDNASTATYASNWHKLDYTDAVLSVAGKTGAVTLAASDIASGTLTHERGGLEADVSAYDGLVKISGGATSAVTAPTGTIVGNSDSQTLTNKTIDGDNNTISNLDLGNEVDWAAADDITTRSAFASGDKLIIFEAGVGLRKIDYDDLPGAGAGLSNIVEDTSPQLGGFLDGQGHDVTGIGVLTMVEQAAAEADVAGNGQVWVKTATPNELWFTDDAGTDAQVALRTHLASTSNGLGASLIGIEDAGTLITATTVEGALAENRAAIDAIEADYLTSSSIGVSVQAYDADLTSWAGVTRASGFDTFAATPSSANLAATVTDETGTGALVFANSPTLVTPALGTPASGTLTNCTGLPVAGITASTSTALGVGSIELGHASDTTISRVSAGLAAIEGSNILMAGTADQTIAGGANVTPLSQGTKTTGTYTLDYGARPLQYLVNGGAFTLAPDTSEGTMVLLITNDGSAGAITTSGWTQVTGDSFTTTNGHDFICYCTTHNNGTSDFSHLHVVAMQ